MNPEQPTDKLPAAAADIAGDIRKLARMESSCHSPNRNSDAGTGKTFGGIPHLVAISVGEIDRVIAELTQIRDHLQNESERVQNEIAGYTQVTQVALQVALASTEVITHGPPQFRSARSGPD